MAKTMKLTIITSLVLTIRLINLCAARTIVQGSTPWMVIIKKYDLMGDSTNYVDHCVGVLTEPDVVLTNVKCLDTFPANHHMVLFAGSSTTEPTWSETSIQKFLPFGTAQPASNAMIVPIVFTPQIQRTKNVDLMATCMQQQCRFEDKFGYQYGWDLNSLRTNHYGYSDNDGSGLQITRYDFSNSLSLCRQINEDPEYKYCTHYHCNDHGEKNYGGEPLTKVYKGQSYLMGFWDYDVCGYDNDIRVFQRLRYDEPTTTDLNTQ